MVVSKRFLPYFLWAFVVCLVGLSNAQDVPECSASIPCKAGCCSKFGFCGLGPDCKKKHNMRGTGHLSPENKS